MSATARVGLLLAGLVLIGGVVAIATSRERAPLRCAPGMVALGPRCCGAGQHLSGDRCEGQPTACAPSLRPTPEGCVATPRAVLIAGGELIVGPSDWEAQGVVTARRATVAPFRVDVFEVTESRYQGCVEARACASVPLSGEPGRALSGVTQAEAAAFCAWAGGSLPTSDQLAFASAGVGSRRYPWGDTGAVCRRAAFGLASGPCGEGARGPEIAGSHPDGGSPEGVADLAGNVAEWTTLEPEASVARVRGGSWADAAAAALRSWHSRELSAGARSPEVGFRCAFDAQ